MKTNLLTAFGFLIALTVLSADTPAAADAQQEKIRAAAKLLSDNFDVKVDGAYSKDGAGSIVGQAFLRQRGGGVVYAAGREVILRPNSDWYSLLYQAADATNLAVLIELSPEVRAYTRKVTKITTADAEGHFEFKNLPPGKYRLTTFITWEVPGELLQGGKVEIDAKVADDEPARVILTR